MEKKIQPHIYVLAIFLFHLKSTFHSVIHIFKICIQRQQLICQHVKATNVTAFWRVSFHRATQYKSSQQIKIVLIARPRPPNVFEKNHEMVLCSRHMLTCASNILVSPGKELWHFFLHVPLTWLLRLVKMAGRFLSHIFTEHQYNSLGDYPWKSLWTGDSWLLGRLGNFCSHLKEKVLQLLKPS